MVKHRGINPHIGLRVRQRRAALGMTQRELSQAIQVSLSELRNYECGKIHIDHDQLERLASVLKVSVYYFFQDNYAGIPPEDVGAPAWGHGAEGIQGNIDQASVSVRESLEFLKAYRSIKPAWIRHRVYLMVLNVSRGVRHCRTETSSSETISDNTLK